MAQCEVLQGKLALAAAEEGEETKHVEQEGDHRAGIVAGSAPPEQTTGPPAGFWPRTSIAGGSVVLEAGQPFTLTTEPVEGSGERVGVSYAGLPGTVGVGDALLLADGAIHLRVEGVRDSEIQSR